MVVAAVRPARPRGTGTTSWETIAAHREQITTWLEQGLTVTKVHVLLERRGVAVPYRTLHRFAVAELGFGRRRPTVPVADGDPGGRVRGRTCDPRLARTLNRGHQGCYLRQPRQR